MTHDSGKSIAEDDTKLADLKVFMEAMMTEMRRVMKDRDGAGSRTDRSDEE